MAPGVAEVLAAVRAMPRDQVADLAYEVLRVLDGSAGGDQAAADAAWDVELQRRVDELESGAVRPVLHEETVGAARALLADHRK